MNARPPDGLKARIARHAAALAGYSALAAAFCYPLPLHFFTRFVGTLGDTYVGVWNMWYFRYALTVLKTNPLWTDHLYWPYGANLILHHYTLSHDVFSFFLIPWLGLEGAYNLSYIVGLVLAGYGIFLLLRDWEMDWDIAFVCGAAFAFSITVKEVSCVDLFSLQPLPFFVWMAFRAMRGRRAMDAFWAALCLIWVWCYNYYHFLFCAVLTAFFFFWQERPLQLSVSARAAGRSARWAARGLDVLLAAAAAAVAWSVWRGQREFHGAGSFREILAYTAPYLVFWGLLGARLFAAYSISCRSSRAAWRRDAVFPYAAIWGFWLLLNLPLVVATVFFMSSGDYGTTPHPWRGGGNPVDLVWLILPRFCDLWTGYGAYRPVIPPVSWVLLLGAVWLWRRRVQDRWAALWGASAAFSALMSLGPWLKVAGVHTYLPLPFYFMHLLPVFNNMQVPHKFGPYIILFSSLLFAVVLRELRAAWPGRWARWLPWLALGLISLDYASGSRQSVREEAPALIRRLADRPDGPMLTIPTGGIFNGQSAEGALGVTPSVQMQTVHHKPLVGGYLTRVSNRTFQLMRGDAFLHAVISAQDGGEPDRILRDPLLVGRHLGYLHLRYVLVDVRAAAPKLQAAVSKWPLRLLDEEGGLRLYGVD